MNRSKLAAVSRRDFLQTTLGLAGALALPPSAWAASSGGGDGSGALQGLITAGYTGTDFIGTPNGCMTWGIVGFFVLYGEVFFILANYSPTGLIEVHKHVGGSIFYEAGDRDTGTINQGIAGFRTEGGYEVRVWEVLDDLRELMFEGYYECVCKPKKVQGQGGGGESSDVGQSSSDANEGNSVCEAAAQIIEGVVSEVIGELDVELGDYLKLSYDSGIDAVNWRTGCRDMGAAFTEGVDIIEHCILGVDEDFPINPNADPVCVGDWGPLLPRQMRADGASPPVAAAHAGYRAINTAARVTKRFPYPVHLYCKYQPIYPKLAPMNCFNPGAGVGEVDKLTTNSSTGKFGFIWWSPTGCVKTAEQLENCFGS